MKKRAGKEKEHGAKKTAEIRELTTWRIKKKHAPNIKNKQPEKVVPKLLPVKPERRETETRTGLSKSAQKGNWKQATSYTATEHIKSVTCNSSLHVCCELHYRLELHRTGKNQARNRVISKKSCWSHSTQTLDQCGQTRLQEEEQTKGN